MSFKTSYNSDFYLFKDNDDDSFVLGCTNNFEVLQSEFNVFTNNNQTLICLIHFSNEHDNSLLYCAIKSRYKLNEIEISHNHKALKSVVFKYSILFDVMAYLNISYDSALIKPLKLKPIPDFTLVNNIPSYPGCLPKTVCKECETTMKADDFFVDKNKSKRNEYTVCKKCRINKIENPRD
jgi:hypothetical protein